MATIEDLAKDMKALRKAVRKIISIMEDPTGEKAAARAATNCFNKPQEVTAELRAFLGLAADEKISRSQVTSRVSEYVEKNALKAGQNINMNPALKSLLTPPEGVQVTYLNLQKYINRHYIKAPKPVKTPVAAPVESPVTPVAEAAPKKSRPKVVKA